MSEASPLERLVMPVAVAVVRPFIEAHHYSKSINGCKVSMAFALYEADIDGDRRRHRWDCTGYQRGGGVGWAWRHIKSRARITISAAK